MADNTVNSGDTPELSPEEMLKRRAEITAYYEDNIPSLKIQLEYEELLRDIEKTRAERLQAQMFITKSMAEPPAPPMPKAGPTTSVSPKTGNPNVTPKQKIAKKVQEGQAKKKAADKTKTVKDATN